MRWVGQINGMTQQACYIIKLFGLKTATGNQFSLEKICSLTLEAKSIINLTIFLTKSNCHIIPLIVSLSQAKQEWQAEKEKLLKDAKEKLAAEVQRVKSETEHKCKKELSEQVQKLSDEISQTKKKQWVSSPEAQNMSR